MRRLVLAIVAAAATAVFVPSATAGAQIVPLKASLGLGVVATAPPADCGLPSQMLGTGQMSHLGKVAIDIRLAHCAMVGPTEMVMTGTATIVGANGDEFDSPLWTAHIDVVSGAFTFSDLDLLGGTGRFEHASGTLTGAGTLDLDPLSPTYLTGAYTLAGAITNVSSTR